MHPKADMIHDAVYALIFMSEVTIQCSGQSVADVMITFMGVEKRMLVLCNAKTLQGNNQDSSQTDTSLEQLTSG